jgi:hypothetical protein
METDEIMENIHALVKMRKINDEDVDQIIDNIILDEIKG